MTAKGVQTWSADITALIIEQFRQFSELNLPLEKVDQPLWTLCKTCSCAFWPQRGAVATTQAAA